MKIATISARQKPDKPYLTTNEMAAKHGVSSRTLRFYEQKGLLSPVKAGSMRLYCVDDQVRMELIAKAKRLGFTLREIASLLQATSPSQEARPASTLTLSASAIERQIALLEHRKRLIDEALDELRTRCPSDFIM